MNEKMVPSAKKTTRVYKHRMVLLELGEQSRADLERIAKSNQRTLVGQVRYWISRERAQADAASGWIDSVQPVE